MKKVTLEDIKNHFSYCIDEGLAIGEYEGTLLNHLYKKVEQLEKNCNLCEKKTEIHHSFGVLNLCKDCFENVKNRTKR